MSGRRAASAQLGVFVRIQKGKLPVRTPQRSPHLFAQVAGTQNDAFHAGGGKLIEKDRYERPAIHLR